MAQPGGVPAKRRQAGGAGPDNSGARRTAGILDRVVAVVERGHVHLA